MAKSKRASKKNKKETSHWWKDRHPVFRFILAFIGLMLLFYVFFYSPLYRDFLEKPFLAFQASISSFFLNLFGYDTQAEGGVISGALFSVNIKNGCDGLEAIAIFLSGILIFPTTLRNKLSGLALGLAVLLPLNIIRIIGLYIAGVYVSEDTFDLLHVQGGVIIYTMISVVIWFVWMSWVLKKDQPS